MANRKPPVKETVRKVTGSTRNTVKATSSSARVSRSRSNRADSTINAPESIGDLATDAPKFKVSKKTGYILAGLLAVGLIAFFGSQYFVVAWVDSKPITRFEYYSALDKRFGKDLKEELIVQKLLENEASQKGVTVSGQELSEEISKIEEQQGGADKLNQILQAQNIGKDEFDRLIKLQLIRTKLFAEGAEASDGAVMAYITENKDALPTSKDESGKDITPENDPKLKDSIKEQLKQQKINQNFSTWLQENLQGPRVSRI